jgi:hypothetical protein
LQLELLLAMAFKSASVAQCWSPQFASGFHFQIRAMRGTPNSINGFRAADERSAQDLGTKFVR